MHTKTKVISIILFELETLLRNKRAKELLSSEQGCGTVDIIYHRLEVNGGPGKARNVGAKLAGSDWIAFQDSDDLLSGHLL